MYIAAGEGSPDGRPNAVADNNANTGTGKVLEGEIFKNIATTVTVANGTLGNTADVTQFKNEPCP